MNSVYGGLEGCAYAGRGIRQDGRGVRGLRGLRGTDGSIWAAEYAECAERTVLIAADYADHAEPGIAVLALTSGLLLAVPAIAQYQVETQKSLYWGFCYHEAHYEFGDGFLEKLCHRVMVIALADAGLKVTEGMRFDVHFREHRVGRFFADLVVNDLVLVEVKSCPALEPRHRAQVINYLRASPLEVGLLLNFGPKREFDRIVYANERKKTLAETNRQLTVPE